MVIVEGAMNRLSEFFNVVKHKLAFLKVRNKNAFLRANIGLSRTLLHDTGKAINILLFGDHIATKIHRAMAGHHKEDRMSFVQKAEAFCDWESARFTKPTKPLNGLETALKYYAHIEMSDVINGFIFAKYTSKRNVLRAMRRAYPDVGLGDLAIVVVKKGEWQ